MMVEESGEPEEVSFPYLIQEYIDRENIEESHIQLVKKSYEIFENEINSWDNMHARGDKVVQSQISFRKILQALGFEPVSESLSELVQYLKTGGSGLSSENLLSGIQTKFSDYLVPDFANILQNAKVVAKEDPEETVADLLHFKVLLWAAELDKSFKKFEKLRVLYYIRVNRIWLGIKQDNEFDNKLLALNNVQINSLANHLSVLDGTIEKLRDIKNILTNVGFDFYVFAEKEIDHAYLKRCSDAMNLDFKDHWGVLETFKRHVQDCVDIHRNLDERQRYFAPYTTVLQSSGKGKTHLVHRYGEEELLLYISLGNSDSHCFPPGNRHIPKYLTSSNRYEPMLVAMCRIFLLFLRQAKDLIETERYRNVHIDEEVRKKFLQEFLRLQETFIGGSERFYSSYNLLPDTSQKLLKALTEELEQWGDSVYGKVFRHFTLVLDEARALLKDDNEDERVSLFRLCRRAIREINLAIKKDTRIFVVLLDTSSRVSNFTPSARADASQKNSAVNPGKLHAPFIHVTNKDLYFFELKEKLVGDEIFKKINFFKLGRPIWLIDLNESAERDESSKVEAAFTLAKKKLLGGIAVAEFVDTKKSVISDDVKLALLGIRIPLAIARYGRLAESMPASHMRTIRSLSDSRELIYSAYNREPVLACAAASLSLSYLDFSPYSLLDTLENLVLTGLVNVGDQGEQLLAYLYILARDILAADINGSKTDHPLIKVKALLDFIHSDAIETLKNDAKRREKNLSMLLNGEVSYCQFIDIENTPDMNQLEDGFYGGTAFIARPNQAGVDMFIPVRVLKTKKHPQFNCNLKGDLSKPAKNGRFINADDILRATSRLVPNDQNIEVKPATLETLKSAMNFSLADKVEDKGAYLYSAICIQSKNSTTDSTEANKGIDLRFSGVITAEAKNIPCISIKHVLRCDPQIDIMKGEGRPYRHGIVIRGLDSEKMLNGFDQQVRQPFLARVLNILSLKANENVHNSTLDLKLQSAADHNECFRVSNKLFEDFTEIAIENSKKRPRPAEQMTDPGASTVPQSQPPKKPKKQR
jgi:hypothetical protein